MASVRTWVAHAANVLAFLAMFFVYVVALTVGTAASWCWSRIRAFRTPAEPSSERPSVDA